MMVTLWSGSAPGSERRNDRVAGLVIRAVHAIELAERNRPALDSHQHLVARFLEVAVHDRRAAGAPCEQRRFVHQIGEVGAREAGRSARNRSEVHVGVDGHFARVDAEDGFASLQIGVADGDLPIEAAGPQQRRIQDVLPVRGRDHDDALVTLEAVHLHEQLVERLLALLVTQRVAAAAAADGVELVDEHDAGRDGGVRRGTGDERGTRRRPRTSRRNRSRWRRGTARRLRPQSIAPAASCRCRGGRRAARPSECGRRSPSSGPAPEEVDDFLDFVLRLVHACDVLKRDDVVAALGDARPRRHRRDAAGGGAIDREAQKREEGGRRGHRGPAQGRRVGRRHDVHADVPPDQVGHERRSWPTGIRAARSSARPRPIFSMTPIDRSPNRTWVTPPASIWRTKSEKAMTGVVGGPADEVVSDSQGRKQGAGDDREREIEASGNAVKPQGFRFAKMAAQTAPEDRAAHPPARNPPGRGRQN